VKHYMTMEADIKWWKNRWVIWERLGGTASKSI